MIDVVRRLASPREALDAVAGDDEIVTYRFEAPLFFPNAEAVRTRVMKLAFDGEKHPKVIILDGAAITEIDTTATYALARLRDELELRGVRLVFAGFPEYVKRRLEVAHSAEPEIDAFSVFNTVEEAEAASKAD
jgi:sulfate permease, SulP family